ncbi:MAG TPA: serine/threonine-protein kinase [Fimbriiglobus sp.]|nr:serine/threonine-protein kinase [Fimbriiglobus sp.]
MAPPTGTALLSVADFLRDLGRSSVVEPSRVDRLYAEAPPDRRRRPDTLADHLVERGELTRFQADKILDGRWHELVLGPYRLLCPLGRGGMGIVYLARAEGPPVALKVLPPRRAADEPRMLTRFMREIDVGLTLPPHPHLTRTLDAGASAGVHYLAMEYVPGRTVKQLVTDAGPMPVGRAARVFADVAAGLHQAHLAGYIHRDLKPANVVVTPGGRAKLLDFGFALVRGEPAPTDPTVLGGPGYAVGTMDYLAPEQSANPLTVGPAADVYSLGCSLYFAVSGCPPFPGGSPQDKIRWQRTAEPPLVSLLNPTVLADFASLISQLMAKDPAARPQTAEEVGQILAAWADPIRPDPVGETSPSAEAVRLAESNWEATRDDAPADDESRIVDDGETADAEPWWQTDVRVPTWFLVAAAVGGALALVLAVFLGWALARWSAG